jgi:DNA polymerase-3 subunit alpha
MAAAPRTNGDTVHFTPWSTIEKLGHERDLLGFYVTGHPLDAYRELIEGGAYMRINDLADQEDKGMVKIAGSISAFEKKLTRKEGKPFAILTIEDFTGSVEVMVWADVYAKSAKEIDKGKIVTVTGKLDKREDGDRYPYRKGQRATVNCNSGPRPPISRDTTTIFAILVGRRPPNPA